MQLNGMLKEDAMHGYLNGDEYLPTGESDSSKPTTMANKLEPVLTINHSVKLLIKFWCWNNGSTNCCSLCKC